MLWLPLGNIVQCSSNPDNIEINIAVGFDKSPCHNRSNLRYFQTMPDSIRRYLTN